MDGGGGWRVNKGAAALTDLFSWTFPAESHLSETLPAVRGLRAPDKTTQGTASRRRQRKPLCVCSYTAGRRVRPPHTYLHLSFVPERVCTDLSNVVY